MRKLFLLSCVLLSACATTQNQQVTPANPILQKPMTFESPQLSSQDYKLAYDNSPAIEKAYQEYLKTGKAPNIITSGFEQFAYGNTQPIINTSPLELTVISLQIGENVTNVSSGDPLRWSYSLAYSGGAEKKQAHVMIKPSQASISTDLVITTDKRMYTLKLVSTSSNKYARDIRFWYPDEIQSFWGNQQGGGLDISTMTNISLDKMNFNYKIKTSFFNAPIWKPIRVFDDGTHTFIQFPDSINNQDLPALFIVNQNTNSKELVNYRVKKPYFVVDKLFKEAVLAIGVGSNQSKVTIINTSI